MILARFTFAGSPRAAAAALAVLSLLACGEERPTHAGLANMPTDADIALDGGAAPAMDYSGSMGNASEGSLADYTASVAERLAANQARLADPPKEPAQRDLLDLQKKRLERKLEAPEPALAQNREARNAAGVRVRSFLVRFSPDLEWEADYAMQSGDLGLVSALVQEVVDKLRRQSGQGGRPSGRGASPDTSDSAAQDLAAARKMAAEVFLQIGKLAEDLTELETAERNYELARAYNPDLGIAADAAEAEIALLRALSREKEADKLEAEISEVLTR